MSSAINYLEFRKEMLSLLIEYRNYLESEYDKGWSVQEYETGHINLDNFINWLEERHPELKEDENE